MLKHQHDFVRKRGIDVNAVNTANMLIIQNDCCTEMPLVCLFRENSIQVTTLKVLWSDQVELHIGILNDGNFVASRCTDANSCSVIDKVEMCSIQVIYIDILWPSSTDTKVEALARSFWDWGFSALMCTKPIVLLTAELSADFTVTERMSCKANTRTQGLLQL